MYPLVFIFFGLLVGNFLTVSPRDAAGGVFHFVVGCALGIGLYGSVYGIDIKILKNNLSTVLSAITVGVILKILVISALLSPFLGFSFSVLIATIIAQIDPLSTAAITDNNKITIDGKTIIRAWSSFDDPVTIIVAIWIAMFLYSENHGEMNFFWYDISISFLLNIILSAVIWLIYKMSSRSFAFDCLLLGITFIVGIFFELFLAIAIIGLFLRPRIEKVVDNAVLFSLFFVSFLMGIILAEESSIYLGVAVGVFTVVSQIIAAIFLTRRLSYMDRVKLSIAHQSGVTAISLTLYFAQYNSHLLGIIAVAIITINILYLINNYVVDRFMYDKL